MAQIDPSNISWDEEPKLVSDAAITETKIDPANVTWDETPRGLVADQPQPDLNNIVWDDTSTQSKDKSSAIRRYVADPLIGLGQGIIGAKEAAVGILDIPTFGVVGKVNEAIEKNVFGGTTQDLSEKLQELKTPEQLAQEQAVQEAKGFTGTAKALIDNPAALLNTVIESVPSMLGGAGIARGGIALAAKAGKTLSPLVAGAVGEGVVAAGAQAEDIRKQTESGYLSPKQAGLATISGGLTSALGLFGGRMAQKLGIADIETLTAGGSSEAVKRSILVQAAKGALAEGALEELPQSFQEQMLQNFALGKDPMEGVAEAAATGLLSGGVMGGGTNFLSQAVTNYTAEDPATSTTNTDPTPQTPTESQIKPPTTPTPEEKDEAATETIIQQTDETSSNPILGIGSILLQGENNARSNRTASRRSAKLSGVGTEPAPTVQPKGPDGVPVVSLGDDAGQLNERETKRNATLGEEKVEKEVLDRASLQNSIFTDSNKNKVKQFQNKNKSLAETHTVEEFQEAEDGPTYYALVPKKQLKGTTLQNVLTELTLYDAPKKGKKFDFTKPSEIKQFLEAKIDKTQLDEIKQDPKVYSKLAAQYRKSVTDTGSDRYTGKLEEADLEQRRNTFNTKVKENPALQELPAELDDDFVKAGTIYSEKAPIERTQDPAELTQLAIDDLAFEQAQDELENSNTDAIDAEIQAIAQEKGLKEGEYSIYNPLQFMTPEEVSAIQIKHINTKKPTNQLVKRKDRRQAFFDKLTPEEQSMVDTKYQNYIGRGLVARLDRASGKVVSEQKLRQENEDIKEVENFLEAKADEEFIKKISKGKGAIMSMAERMRQFNRVRIRINNNIINAIKEGKSLSQILKDIASANEFNRTFKYETVAEHLSKFVGRLYTDPKTKRITKNETKVVFGTVAEGRPAAFDPAAGTIIVDLDNIKGRHLGEIMVHETMHATMDHVIDNRVRLSSSQNLALDRLERIYKHVIKELPRGNQFEISNLKEFVAEAFSNREFQKALAEIKPRPGAKFIQVIRDIARSIAQTLGFTPYEGTVLKDAIQTVENILQDNRYAPPSMDMRAMDISYAPKKAEDKADKSVDELISRVERDDYIQRGFFGRSFNTLKRIFGSGQQSIDFLVTNFQNSRYAIKKWQDDLEKAGLLKVAGNMFNNIFDKITTAFGQADLRFKEYLKEPLDNYRTSIAEYIKQSGIDSKKALAKLHTYLMALHEPERRKIKYIKNVPLSEEQFIPDPANPGQNISPAEFRRRIFEDTANNQNLDDATIAQYRAILDKLTDSDFTFNGKKTVDANGFSPAGYKSIDPANEEYSVSTMSSGEVNEVINAYNNDKDRALIDKVRENMKEVQARTMKLNQEGHYAPKGAQNIIKLYAWEDYVPYKGRLQTKDDIAAELEFTGERMSGELRQVEDSFEGRKTEADNPVMQVMVDAAVAAARAGRKELTQAIFNAIDQGLLKGKIINKATPFSFNDKYIGSQEIQKELNKKNRILHYAENGDIYVMEIQNPNELEAIRRTYQDAHPVLDILNVATSALGQTHTRFNPAFPVLNFVRDALTNAYVITAEMGIKNTFSYLNRISQQVVAGGMFKTGKIATAYIKGNIDKIREMAKTDKYAQDMLEYLENGGMISVVQGLTVANQIQQLHRTLGKNKIVKTNEGITNFFDSWMATFELASRVAAYQTFKTDYLANYMPANPTKEQRAEVEKAAKEKATVYAKRLANFEEVGKMGKEIGAWFMFFRPSATGAVRALESIAPALRSWESVQANLPDTIKNNPEALARSKAEFERSKRAATAVGLSILGMGAVVYLMAVAMAGDDDEDRNKALNDDMGRWSRFARFWIGEDKVLQIPWGFGLGGLAAMGAQITAMFTAKENSPAQILGNITNIAIDSFIPLPVSRMNPADNPMAFIVDSILPSIARPPVEFAMNMNAFGQQIYNNRQARYGDAYTGGDNIPDLWKDASAKLYDMSGGYIDWSPNTMYFFANNYVDGFGRMAQNGYGIGLTIAGQKDFEVKRDTVFLESFISNYSKVDQRAFARIDNIIKEKEKRLNTLIIKPDLYVKYIEKNPFDVAIVENHNDFIRNYINPINSQLKTIRRMPDLSPKERKDLLDPLKELQLVYKRMAAAQAETMMEMND